MTDGAAGDWAAITKWYAALSAPYKPPASVRDTLAQETSGHGGEALLLGVTPCFADLPGPLTAVELSADVITALWPGDTENRRAEQGDWRNLGGKDGRFARIYGDGALNAVASLADVERVLQECRRLLADDGIFASRVFTRSDPVPNLRGAMDSAKTPRGMGYWRWVLAAIQAEPPEHLVLFKRSNDLIEREFGSLEAFCDLAQLSAEARAFFERARGMNVGYLLPPRAVFVDLAEAAGFSVTFVETAGYDCAEDCPILMLTHARPQAARQSD